MGIRITNSKLLTDINSRNAHFYIGKDCSKCNLPLKEGDTIFSKSSQKSHRSETSRLRVYHKLCAEGLNMI